MKKLFSVLLAICLLAACLPLSAGAADQIVEIRGDEQLTLEGVLTECTYEMNSSNTGHAYLLKLNEEITVSLFDSYMSYNGKNINIQQVQLNFSNLPANIADKVNSPIKVTGKAMIGHNAHHLTPVVLTETEILSKESEDEEEIVSDAFYKTFCNDGYDYSYRIPQINLDIPNVQKLNEEIYHELYDGGVQKSCECLERGALPGGLLLNADYDWSANDDILSIQTEYQYWQGGAYVYHIYNISISTGNAISGSSVVEMHGWSEDQYNSAVEQALAECFKQHNKNAAELPALKDEYKRLLRETLSAENLANVEPYLNQKNELCILGRVRALAGADGYNYLLNLEKYKDESDPDDSPSPFSDVFSDDYYKEAVEWAVEQGITNGTGNGKFSPNAACTRAQIVTFLWRAAGSPEPTSGLSMFSDVEENEYYGEAVRWAIEQGITNGTGNGKFSPEAACTRGQAVTFLWRAAGEPSAGTAGFSDVYTSDYYAPAVNWAVQNDVTAGTGNNRFSPNWKCTRAQIVTFLYRYAN